ncbi:hypothetical protein [Spirosoma pollinicola]|uniref:Outer membrane protein beta-barrel domain-containing protein n=1 Tax=Spirosoma pollinicola TaxID=2057025 RepID=A0A2K8Z767_9BACT|nr:hypothetical protein [Spirosoma pollinicola]AUD05700.1 hypothetical protein CWM47_29970 [Spirosoma pollinicola]
MKKLLTTTSLFMGLAICGLAQSRSDSSGSGKPLIDEKTKREVRQKAEQASEKMDEEIDKSISYQQANQLSWFEPNNLFLGGGLGMGASSGQVYLAFNSRIGYFFQPGFAAGLRYDADRLVGNKYHSRQVGAFARYYPFRTRISSFVGASLNSGREFSENVPADAKYKYTSVGLEIGVMAWILHRLGAEVSYESSFYNKIDPTVSRGKGGRLKFGVNYYFGRVAGRGVKLAK